MISLLFANPHQAAHTIIPIPAIGDIAARAATCDLAAICLPHQAGHIITPTPAIGNIAACAAPCDLAAICPPHQTAHIINIQPAIGDIAACAAACDLAAICPPHQTAYEKREITSTVALDGAAGHVRIAQPCAAHAAAKRAHTTTPFDGGIR